MNDEKTQSIVTALEAEKAVLGFILSGESSSSAFFLEKLTEEHFESPLHLKIYRTIKKVEKERDRTKKAYYFFNVITSIEKEDRQENSGTAKYIEYLVDLNTFNFDIHAAFEELYVAHKHRKSINLGKRLIEYGSNRVNDIKKVLQSVAEEIRKTFVPKTLARSIGQILSERNEGEKNFQEEIESRQLAREECERQGKIYTPGMQTGLSFLDKTLGGLQKGHLIVIASRPATGKSTIIINIATHVALKLNRKVIFYSIEMTSHEITSRVISSTIGEPLKGFYDGTVKSDWIERLKKQTKEGSGENLLINDSSATTIESIEEDLTLDELRESVSLVVVDYLQIINTKEVGNRRSQVSRISNALKRIAKQQRLPIVCAAQLSRVSEVRKNRWKKGASKSELQLSDIRESGAIEQDADSIIFIQKTESDDETVYSEVDISVAKNRHGQTGKTAMIFNKEIARFYQHTKF